MSWLRTRRRGRYLAGTGATGTAIVGVAERGDSAEFVTIASGGSLLDRRRVDLTDGDLPTHHDGSWAVGRYTNSPWAREITLRKAIELVEVVRRAAPAGARQPLEDLAVEVPAKIVGIAIRKWTDLPSSVEECIRDNWSQAIADSVMYRKALAAAAERRGWAVSWHAKETFFAVAATHLSLEDFGEILKAMGRLAGPPGRQDSDLQQLSLHHRAPYSPVSAHGRHGGFNYRHVGVECDQVRTGSACQKVDRKSPQEDGN